MAMPRAAYFIDVSHENLGKFRRIKGSDKYVVEQQARSQQLIWDEQWAKRCEVESARKKRANAALDRESKGSDATHRTQEAHQAIADATNIIAQTLTIEQAT